jgi:DNA polymerase III subunit delta'
MPFDSFLGNARAVAALREMLRSGRVPGALLFAGPEGVGKKTLALMLAKALNCERLRDDFCGECARCRKAQEMWDAAREDLARRRDMKEAARRVDGLVYFDLALIEPITRFILTEQIRQLRQTAYTHPFELRRRVFIIDQVQDVHWQAVDLLLKVLEEPPETTTFVLVCPNAGELRPTIRSRCTRLQFAPVEESLIARLLAERAQLSKSERALVARLAAGSVGKALTLDPEVYLARRERWLDYLGSVAVKGGAEPNWRALFDATRFLTEQRDQLEETLEVGYGLLRDLLQAREAAPDSQLSDPELLPQLREWAGKLGLAGLEALKSGLDQAYRLQIRNVNQQLGLEALALELIPSPRREAPGRPLHRT